MKEAQSGVEEGTEFCRTKQMKGEEMFSKMNISFVLCKMEFKNSKDKGEKPTFRFVSQSQ